MIEENNPVCVHILRSLFVKFFVIMSDYYGVVTEGCQGAAELQRSLGFRGVSTGGLKNQYKRLIECNANK